MLTTLEYLLPGIAHGEVAYLVSDGVVYFSTINTSRSSINMAEDLVMIIASEAGVDWKGTTFVDIQTHRGYPRILPGDHEAIRLTYEIKGSRPYCMGWYPHKLPEPVLQEFAELIAG